MIKKKLFVSFDYERDGRYYFLLKAWNANPSFEFEVIDRTPSEIRTERVDVVKRVLSRKIDEADFALVLIGRDINLPHPDRHEIGYTNWQNYEVARSVQLGKRLIGVRLQRGNPLPEELRRKGCRVLEGFIEEGIVGALRGGWSI